MIEATFSLGENRPGFRALASYLIKDDMKGEQRLFDDGFVDGMSDKLLRFEGGATSDVKIGADIFFQNALLALQLAESGRANNVERLIEVANQFVDEVLKSETQVVLQEYVKSRGDF